MPAVCFTWHLCNHHSFGLSGPRSSPGVRMRRQDSNDLFSSVEEELATGDVPERQCLHQRDCCTHRCEIHPAGVAVKGERVTQQRGLTTRYSEGYGTEEEGVPSDPQGDSDADADIEDTDCRWQDGGSLHRISSRRRRRQRVTRQDTTESEDDGGRSHRTHRWNLRLSPPRTHSRTIVEESVSQVRPLVLCRPCSDSSPTPVTDSPAILRWTLLGFSLSLILLLLVPCSLIIILIFFLLGKS